MHERYLNAIRAFEGFTPQATADYGQWSIGYGTRARHSGEMIDRVEADRRFRSEIAAAIVAVERFAPTLEDGPKAALASLTFNAGPGWMSDGLGAAVRSGDLAAARRIFSEYVNAGGVPLPGLVRRRTAEAQWFDDGGPGAQVGARAATGGWQTETVAGGAADQRWGRMGTGLAGVAHGGGGDPLDDRSAVSQAAAAAAGLADRLAMLRLTLDAAGRDGVLLEVMNRRLLEEGR
jgi:lysozyme